MHFFIDEGGTFTPATAGASMRSLSTPHKSVGPERREIERVSRDWPRNNGEVREAGLSTQVAVRQLHTVAGYPESDLSYH